MNVTDTTARATSYSGLSYSSAPAARTTKSSLDSTDFMKLLATQFQNQDPMKPMEDTAFLAQMAQFTSLEQTQGMASTITSLRNDQQWLSASSYLGRNITVTDSAGKAVTGKVSAVENSADGPLLYIGDQSYLLSNVSRVEEVPPAA